jgi:membrane protease YdiL (CAAX protease family)
VAASERQLPFRAVTVVLFCIVTSIVVASFLFVHLLGLGFFFFTSGGLDFGTVPFRFPVFVFFFFGDYSPFFQAREVFAAIWVIYVVCFAAAWRWRQSFHGVLKKALSGSRDIFGNFLFSMPLLSSMALTAAVAIIYSQTAFGVGTGKPPLPANVHEAFLQLAISPLVEELGFRIVPIGLVVVVFVFVARSLKASSPGRSRLKLFFLAFVYPEGAKKMAGLPTVGERGLLKGLSSLEWFMVVVSAGVFGWTHVLSPGWEIGKITSAFVQGFFFAVTYIAYGIEAPILLHWYFNYYFYFFSPEIAESLFPGAINLLSGIELLILVLGVAGWIFFVWEGLRRLLRKQEETREQPVVPPFTSPL